MLLGVAIPGLGVLCYSRFGAGVAMIAGMYAVEAMFMSLSGLQLGITIYYTDIVMIFIAAIALLRWLGRAVAPPQQAGWLLYLLAFSISLGLGIVTFGTVAGVQARTYFYSFAAGAYAMSFPIGLRQVRHLLDALVALTLLFVCLCAYRWTVYYLPIRELLPEEGVYNPDGAIRVIRSFEAIVIAQVLVLGLFFAPLSPWTRCARWIAPMLLTVVVVLQHRSGVVGLDCRRARSAEHRQWGRWREAQATGAARYHRLGGRASDRVQRQFLRCRVAGRRLGGQRGVGQGNHRRAPGELAGDPEAMGRRRPTRVCDRRELRLRQLANRAFGRRLVATDLIRQPTTTMCRRSTTSAWSAWSASC